MFLLEHALWAVRSHEENPEVDVEVFKRWVREGPAGAGVKQAQDEVERTWREWKDVQSGDQALVYGSGKMTGAKL